MELKIEAKIAQNSKEKRTETAQYTVWYGSHYYESLEIFCIAHGLNSRLVSRRLQTYRKKNGSLDWITLADLISKDDRTINIDGRSFKSIQAYLDSQGLTGTENRKRFEKYQTRLYRNGGYDSRRNPDLVKRAMIAAKKELQ